MICLPLRFFVVLIISVLIPIWTNYSPVICMDDMSCVFPFKLLHQRFFWGNFTFLILWHTVSVIFPWELFLTCVLALEVKHEDLQVLGLISPLLKRRHWISNVTCCGEFMAFSCQVFNKNDVLVSSVFLGDAKIGRCMFKSLLLLWCCAVSIFS